VKEEHNHDLSIQSRVAREMKAVRRILEEELEHKVISELSVKFTVTQQSFGQ
jgi:hypothetical protein